MVNIVKNVMTPGAAVILAGDFNVDLTTIDNVSNLNCLKKFISDCRFQSCMPFYLGNLHYIYRCEAHNAYSMINNILVPNFVD